MVKNIHIQHATTHKTSQTTVIYSINIKHSSGHDKRELSKPPLILDSDIHPCKKNDANINEDYLIEVSKHSEI